MTTPTPTLQDVPGSEALVAWFGRVPRFHDAELLELTFHPNGVGRLRIYAWNMTGEVDAQGYYVLDKHAMVTLRLAGVCAIECVDVDMMPGIIFDLEITRTDERFRIDWTASYGVSGTVVAKVLMIELDPGRPRST